MKKKETLIALIILESRLSKVQTTEFFKDLNCDELLLSRGIDSQIIEGLNYLWNYETVIPDENREKRAKFLASNLLRRLNKILKVANPSERKELLEAFIKELVGSDMPFIDKPARLWTQDERRKILKYRYKYALSERQLARRINGDRKKISEWTKALDDNDYLKMGLQTLSEFNQESFFDNKNNSRK